MTVTDVIKDQDDLAGHTYEFVLWPRQWRSYVSTRTHSWIFHRLDERERSNIPSASGIYTLLMQPGIANHPQCSNVMYVGKAVSLRNRFGEYLSKERRETGRPKIFRLLNKYDEHLWFCFTLVPKRQLQAVEDALINAYVPPCNDSLPADLRPVRGAFS